VTEATEPATITDPEWLRQQYAAAIQPLLMDNLPKPIAATRAREIADTVLFVRDRHLAQLRQRLQLADADLANWAAAESADAAAGSYAGRAEEAEQHRDQLAAALAEALGYLYSLERVGGSLIGYQTVNVIPPASYDRWQAVLQAAAEQESGEQLATRAALIRDQAALAQIRLLIAAHRPRLRLADPVLLGKLERVVAQVGELEAAAGERT
jgi:hypothetical protein